MFPLSEKSLLWTIAKSGVMTTFGAQAEKIRENNRQSTRMKIRNLFVTTPFYKTSLCLPLTSNNAAAGLPRKQNHDALDLWSDFLNNFPLKSFTLVGFSCDKGENVHG